MPTNYTPIPDGTAVANTADTFNDRFEELDAAIVDLQAGSAPIAATYITQTPSAGLDNEQALSALATGVLKSTTGTGAVSIATGADLPGMTGASSGAAGAKGAVPQPAAGDQDKYLRGDGTWATPKFAIIEEQQATNTAGGGSVATTWTTRVLNAEVVDANSIVSIGSNQFTPIAGTYRIFVNSPFISATATGYGRIRLRNVTAASVILVSANHAMLVNTQTNMTMMAEFTANGTDAYDIQYYITVARVTNGLGIAVNEASEVEHYTQVILEKIG